MTTMVEIAKELCKLMEAATDPMRALLGRMLQLVMEAETSALRGVERGEERTTCRNAYRQRLFKTCQFQA